MSNANTTRKDIVAAINFKQGEQTRTRWTKIGVAFPSKDGTFFNLKFDFLPTDPNTTIQLRDPRRRKGATDFDPETGEVTAQA